MTTVILTSRLRRSASDGSRIMICPPWRRISRFGRPLTFGPSVFPVMVLLLAVPGRVVFLYDLLEAMYGGDPFGGPINADRCLYLAIMRARIKLKRLGISIVNHHGRGYSLEIDQALEVERSAAA